VYFAKSERELKHHPYTIPGGPSHPSPTGWQGTKYADYLTWHSVREQEGDKFSSLPTSFKLPSLAWVRIPTKY